MTSVNALERVYAHGKPLTVELLLNLGMDKRINSVTSSRRVEGTTLDLAFFGAGGARLTYLKLASEFATDEEMEEAEKSGRSYAANAYGINTGGSRIHNGLRRHIGNIIKSSKYSRNMALDVLHMEGDSKGESSMKMLCGCPDWVSLPKPS